MHIMARRFALALGALMFGLAGLLAGGPTGAAPAAAEQAEPPPGVVALLPADATIRAALSGDLLGDGSRRWVVAYTAPSDLIPRRDDVHLVIAGPDGPRWQVEHEESAALPSSWDVSLHRVDGRDAVAFYLLVGAQTSRLLMLRWDGSAYATVYDSFNTTPAFSVKDFDGDGVPEIAEFWAPYCGNGAIPRLVSVARWDGTTFVEATEYFPQLIEEADARVLAAMSDPELTWDEKGLACLEGYRGLLARMRGDIEAAIDACRRARAHDPSWNADWAKGMCD